MQSSWRHSTHMQKSQKIDDCPNGEAESRRLQTCTLRPPASALFLGPRTSVRPTTHLQQAQRLLAILQLRPVRCALDREARRRMPHAHARLDLVHILATRAARPHRRQLQLRLRYDHIRCLRAAATCGVQSASRRVDRAGDIIVLPCPCPGARRAGPLCPEPGTRTRYQNQVPRTRYREPGTEGAVLPL